MFRGSYYFGQSPSSVGVRRRLSSVVVCRPSSSVNFSFKWLLLWNYWGDLVQIWSQALLGKGLSYLFKWLGHAPLLGQERPQKGKFGAIFKNLLLWNYRPDFKIISQKCSLSNPLPSLFKPCRFGKKHGRQGAGLIFPIWTYSNL